MPAQENMRVSREIYEAFNEGDFDRALELTAPDAECVLYYDGLTFDGREGFRDMTAHHKAPFPDGKVEVIRQSAGEDSVANECIYRATHTAPMHLPDGTEAPPTGKGIELPFCEIFRMEGGKVKSLHSYADNLTAMTRLGLIPAPETAGA